MTEGAPVMLPEIREDRSALRWIRGELDETLRRARTALEDFVDGQPERLAECVDALHHIHGALEMVQVYGAAMLADEMEQLASALSLGQAKRVDAAAEALMMGMVHLPPYLEKVEAGGADVPLVLLPLMNDLRAARDESLISETSLFAPRLNAVIAADTVRPGSGNRDLPRLLHDQRSHFHRGLLNWIRGQSAPAALAQIREVLGTLNSAAGTSRLRRLLGAGEALAIVLASEDQPPALAVKPLFGKLDRVFKQVIDQGEETAMLDFPVDLLKNLLYYVARAPSEDPVVVAVKQAADLVNDLPQETQDGTATGSLGGPDRELFAAVGEALAQDLRDVKDQLDLYMRSDRSQLDRLTGMVLPVQRIGDTLGMVGRGDLRTRLKHRCDELRGVQESGEALPDERLMALASDLLHVESSLVSLSSAAIAGESAEGAATQSLSPGELHQYARAALDEAMTELARIKEAILGYLEAPDHGELLNEVPMRLHAVAGVLQMLQLSEAGHLLQALTPYIVRLASGQSDAPDDEQRDALADVVISTESYMQAPAEPGRDRERILRYAEAALAKLGQGDAAVAEPARPAELVEPAEPAEQHAAEGQDAMAGTTQILATEEDVAPQAVDAIVEQVIAVEQDSGRAGTEAVLLQSPQQAQPGPTPVLAADVVDPEILEIFSEEAEEELQLIQECYPTWRADRGDKTSLQTVRRSFHTLKGSGRIVGANNIGDFAWAVENLLNRVLEGTVPASDAVIKLMDAVLEALPGLVEETRQPGGGSSDVSDLAERAFALASGGTEAELPQTGEPATDEVAAAAPPDTESEQGLGAQEDLAPAVELQFEAPGPADSLDETLEFSAEPLAADGDTGQAENTLTWEDTGHAVDQDDGDSALAYPDAGLELSFPDAERGTQRAGEGLELPLEADGEPVAVPPTPDEELVLDESILSATELEDSEFSELESAIATASDSGLNAVFLKEALGHLGVLADFIQHCRGRDADCAFNESVRRAMHTLRGSSRTARVPAMADLAGSLEDFSDAMYRLHRQADAGTLELLDRSHRALVGLLAKVEDPDVEAPGWQIVRDQIDEQLAQLALLAEEVDAVGDAEKEAAATGGGEALDPELLEIFLEEAKELLDAFEGELADWAAAVGDRLPVARLQRTLHTMKGGARLAGVSAVGDLSHALESVFESVSERRIAGSGRLLSLVRHAGDVLAQDIELLLHDSMPTPHVAMIERLEAAASGGEWDDISSAEATAAARDDMPWRPQDTAAGNAPFEAHAVDDDDGADSELLADSQLISDSELLEDSGIFAGMSPGVAAAELVGAGAGDDATVVQLSGAGQPAEGEGFVARRALPQDLPAPAAGTERVRVSSGTLDQMVNNAGEVSIYRARLEQQNKTSAFNLGELQQTIDRLRSQLRNLELETEAQILSRHEREGDAQADFDPLELDRYSNIQQLSRALSETVEDLSNLGQSLSELNRDTDTLLLQQARVTTDLQDGLLRTRMVKFSSRVPRLERVVRQTSHGLGKQANLEVIGGEEDMDRAILERMMNPLEHLLRNAVSHGIELPDVRLANGKPPQGAITVHLARDGADVVLTLADDGAGLDRDRIRAKAVERGLIEPNAATEDSELYQLILQPGFSTAQELSQVSGRGVGMDIVLTEVKQLGGTLEIDAQPGRGTAFTIRLPFTLAITDALLMTMGDEIYAVPHSSMDGVARISLDELRAIYAGEQDAFSYGGRDYSVRYLGSILGGQAPHPGEGTRWAPLLLVHSGEHRVAIQVDSLLGNRQIVVKSIGAQLSSVRWFTGGTILADGQVALILDVNSLVRAEVAQQPATTMATASPVSKGVSVMVVDDSITVRKVTSRLLERHNMHVITAKDGVDAVTLLQEHHPDVMLLDIEMPRMDGYELARHMRSTPELSDIPIIMITSRTGDKHRTRAMEFGVKRYLGKPYQEADLLENIYTVLADSAL